RGGDASPSTQFHRFDIAKARPDLGKKALESALTCNPDKAIKTLGHIDYKSYCDYFSKALADDGDREAAATIQSKLHDILAARNVATPVLAEIIRTRDSYLAQSDR